MLDLCIRGAFVIDGSGAVLRQAGEIRLEGSDVSRVPPYKRNVNTVFQQYALFPHMNVFDNVAFGPRSQKVDKNDVTRRVCAVSA